MKLTSDYPYWSIRNGLIASYPSLNRNLRCDCVVIGGGITGALVAYHLAQKGADTVLVDRRDVGTGSTSGSTGLLQYEVDTPLRKLIRMVGAKDANRSYQLCGEAITKLRDLSHDLRIPCGFEKKPSLQIARHQNEIPELHEEWQLRRKLGIKVDFWDESQIARHFPFSRSAGLFSANGAQLDPHRLAHGLLAAGQKRGLKVFDRVQIKSITGQKRGVCLRTHEGFVLQARRAVVAAGFESKQFLTANSGQLKCTYALVSEPVKDLSEWFRQCLIWETGLPYLYLRTLPDNRIIVGGEDEDFVNPKRRDSLICKKTLVLTQKFQKLFPDIPLKVEYSWAGTFGETKDGLPYIGTPAHMPHVYFALGYGGNGITYSLIAAEIIRDDFFGKKNPAREIFRFGR